MQRIKGMLKRYEEVIRYVFFGGCTTMVNLISYYLLRSLTTLNYNVDNTIAIVISIIFAYIVNSRFVFCSTVSGLANLLVEAAKFCGARVSTMIIEVAGVFVFVEFIGLPDVTAKIIIQFVVLILNYLISKFFVFACRKRGY